MVRTRGAALVGLLTGLAGLILSPLPSVVALEDRLGLGGLFRLRDVAVPPAGVVIVSIDEAAAVRLDLPTLPRDWPRRIHAELVDHLFELGASAVAFDVEFFRHSPSPADDEALAESLARAGRVVLVQRIEVVRIAGGEVWEEQNPIPPLARAAAALAPAPVPDAPFVAWFWTFLPTPHAGEIPSLPVVALQLHANISARELLTSMSLDAPQASAGEPTDVRQAMQTIRHWARIDPSGVSRAIARLAAAQHSPSRRRSIQALADIYTGTGAGYLNFYGPPGTICTIPYDLILRTPNATPCSIEDSMVFVGVGKGPVARAGQIDTYHTVYGGAAELEFSGVEIHATAFANLQDGRVLQRLDPRAVGLTLLMTGLVFGSAGYGARMRRRRRHGFLTARMEGVIAISGAAVAYGVLAYWWFVERAIVLPILVPLALQAPLAVILGLIARPLRERRQIRAVCLVTDAAGSTALGQRMPHGEYATLMAEYNEAIAVPARRHGGEPLAPQGDGFLCLWRLGADCERIAPEGLLRRQACRAALDIVQAAQAFNRARPEGERLPTRIGLTAGEVTICSDADRGVFEVFGDPVNVAARLRDLNVTAGTSILASEDVVAGLDADVNVRALPGIVEMKGVAHAPRVFEIRGPVQAGCVSSFTTA